MTKKCKTCRIAVFTAIAVVTVAVAAIIINGFTHDAYDDHVWESRNQHPSMEVDTIMPGVIIDSTGIGGMVVIGEQTAVAVKRLSSQFDIDSVATGSSPVDVNYTLSSNGEIHMVLQNDSRGCVSAIFILGGDYFTDSGIGVGSTFAAVFAAYPQSEMRLGEVSDGINGSCELCKAAPGMLFMKWLDDTAVPHVARYGDDGIMESLASDYHGERIDEIVITPAIW